MTRKQLEKQFDELRKCVIAVVRDIGPLTVKRQYHENADNYILGSEPNGDGEQSATLSVVEKTAVVPETTTRH